MTALKMQKEKYRIKHNLLIGFLLPVFLIFLCSCNAHKIDDRLLGEWECYDPFGDTGEKWIFGENGKIKEIWSGLSIEVEYDYSAQNGDLVIWETTVTGRNGRNVVVDREMHYTYRFVVVNEQYDRTAIEISNWNRKSIFFKVD